MTESERQAWDQYAAQAISVLLPAYAPGEDKGDGLMAIVAAAAAKFADALLEERRKR